MIALSRFYWRFVLVGSDLGPSRDPLNGSSTTLLTKVGPVFSLYYMYGCNFLLGSRPLHTVPYGTSSGFLAANGRLPLGRARL